MTGPDRPTEVVPRDDAPVRWREQTDLDRTRDRRLLWRELLVLLLVAAVLIVRQVWLV